MGRFGRAAALTTACLVLLGPPSVAAAPCTSYATQANCAPVKITNKLPPCVPADVGPVGPGGARTGLGPRPQAHAASADAAQAFAIVGDYGLSDAGCEAGVAQLVKAMEQQFGGFDFVVTTGDNGACSEHGMTREHAMKCPGRLGSVGRPPRAIAQAHARACATAAPATATDHLPHAVNPGAVCPPVYLVTRRHAMPCPSFNLGRLRLLERRLR